MSEHEPALARKALDRPRWTGRSAVASPHGGAPWKRPPARAFWDTSVGVNVLICIWIINHLQSY